MAIVAPVAPSAVTPLQTPPSTSDPINFDSMADSFLGGLPTNQTQMNALGTNVYDNAVKTFDSATISKASADAAVPAADTATTAATNATTAYTNMQKLYLGAKTAAPTVDNQGNPLVAGAWYTNTTDNFWYWWTGSIWKLGVGELDTVDFETQVTNKGKVLLTDTVQTVSGIKTFINGLGASPQNRLKFGGAIHSAALNTGNTNWITACKLDTNVLPAYTRFLLTNGVRSFFAEIKFSKSAAGAIKAMADIQVLGAYGYFSAYPAKFRIVDLGTSARIDFCFPGTASATETFEIVVLEDFYAGGRSTSDPITYPLTASGAASGALTPNMLVFGNGVGTGLDILRAHIHCGVSYAAITNANGAVGQTSLATNTAAAG